MKLFQKYRIREAVQWAYPHYMHAVCPLVENNTGDIPEKLYRDDGFRILLSSALKKVIDARYPDGITIERSSTKTDTDSDVEGFGIIFAPGINRLSASGIDRAANISRWLPSTCREYCIEMVKWENDWHEQYGHEMIAAYSYTLKPMPANALKYFIEQYALVKYVFESRRR